MMAARRRRIKSILAHSGEPVIVYQPIVSTASGELACAEALSRFLGPISDPGRMVR